MKKEQVMDKSEAIATLLVGLLGGLLLGFLIWGQYREPVKTMCEGNVYSIEYEYYESGKLESLKCN